MATHEIWVEKYRPKTLEDIILPERIKQKFRERDDTLYGNMMLVGTQGTGKTTLAKILCAKYATKLINASLENGIESVRNQIVQYCQTASTKSSIKAIILDESDHLSNQAQASLRGTIELFHKVARFVFTCNYPERILDPIKSRLIITELDFVGEEERSQILGYYSRIKTICDNEGLTITKDAIIELVKKNYPDMRAIIQALQDISRTTTKITLEAVSQTALHSGNAELYEFLIAESFPPNIYSYIKSNYVNRERDCFVELSSSFVEYCIAKGLNKGVEYIPSIVHKYSYESQGTPDKLVSLLACCFELSRLFR